MGRFIQEDPIGFAGGDHNTSRYVGSQPINYNDPTGLFLDTGANLGPSRTTPRGGGTAAGEYATLAAGAVAHAGAIAAVVAFPHKSGPF